MRPFVTRNNTATLAPTNIILSAGGARRIEGFFFNGDSVSRNLTLNASLGTALGLHPFATVPVAAGICVPIFFGDGGGLTNYYPIPNILVIQFAAASTGGWLYEVTQWFQDR